MIIAIISILIITLLIWSLKKVLPFNVCPICAGVFLTWLWMLVGMFLGLLSTENYQLITAVLMGGTVVGLMSKLEQFIKPKFVLIWKALFVALGFVAVYSLISVDWIIFLVGVILAVAFTFAFKIPKVRQENQESEKRKELEEKMKNCC